MLKIFIVIIVLAILIYGCYRYRSSIANFLRRSNWGSNLLSWIHSVVFDFRMENPDEVPKQIAYVFIGLIIIIAVVAMMAASSNQ